MFEASALWRKRLGQTSKELGKYLRYIFNGHIVVVFLFLIGAAAYYYQAWVETLTPQFPVALIMASLLSLLVTHSPIYTLLKDADRIFLLPLENKLDPYFSRSVLFSFFLQLYGLIFGLAVLMPMYAAINAGNFTAFFLFLGLLAALKIVNLHIRWRVQFYVEISVHRMDSVIRYFVNGVFLYLLFDGASYWLLLPLALTYALLYFFYSYQTKEKGLKWEFLVRQHERRMMAFYRLANMFTDVPILRNSVKRRKWLDFLGGFVSFKRENVYTYLYVKTFVRGGEYFGLFVRLTIIGAIGIYLLPSNYIQLVFVILFLFLTGFQLFPLWKHHQNKIILRLYPVEEEVKGNSFQRILLVLLCIQALLLSTAILITGDWQTALIGILAGLLFSFFFVFVYIKNKLKI